MARSNSNADNYKVKMSLTRLSSKSQEEELFDLCNLSGVTLDPDVFKIVMDLIKLNVQPTALVQMLKKMTAASKGYRNSDSSRNSVGDDVAPRTSTTLRQDRTASEPGPRPERRERTQPLTRREKELKPHVVHK